MRLEFCDKCKEEIKSGVLSRELDMLKGFNGLTVCSKCYDDVNSEIIKFVFGLFDIIPPKNIGDPIENWEERKKAFLEESFKKITQ